MPLITSFSTVAVTMVLVSLSLSLGRRQRQYVALLSILFFFFRKIPFSSGNRIDSRHSFSLTTFDPSGRLSQVERAAFAANMGAPIIGVIVQDSIVMTAPQLLPSPFMTDDGTARFARISPEIMVAHSGLSADGRALLASAQRLAIEHEYTYDENIPIEIFLQQLSLLFQEYTMKPGARPFGVTLLVGYMPLKIARDNGDKQRYDDDDDAAAPVSLLGRRKKPLLCRIDPSGSLKDLGKYGIVHLARRPGVTVQLPPATLLEEPEKNRTSEQAEMELVEAFQKFLKEKVSTKSSQPSEFYNVHDITFLSARLSNDGCFRVRRHET